MIRRSLWFTAILALILSAMTPRNTMAESGLVNGATPAQRHYRSVCDVPAPNTLGCMAVVSTAASGQPTASTSPPAGSYGPVQFHTAYNLPCRIGGGAPQSVCPAPASFGGQTIAIVDASYDPNIESDLATFDTQYGLPACTSRNGCLSILNMTPTGRYAKYYGPDPSWVLEISLDVEVAHAVCQTCKILLVEAKSSWTSDLGAAENVAAQNGATVISNSWGGKETSTETQYDAYWNHPGIATVFSSGDSGFGTMYPAAAPSVLSVGGTTLQLNADNTYGSESVWYNSTSGSGTGSGCSTVEPANSWQTSVTTWSATTCAGTRAVTDVAADADPATGAAVYDSYGYNGQLGWFQVGGTSLSAPIIAGTIALAGGTSSYSNAQQVPYLKFNATNSHDVATGDNGTCGSTMCTAGSGYDGPSGLGTPNGVGGF